MNFLLDHDVPENLARVLLREGHHVARVWEVLGRESPDPFVFTHAKQHELVLVTCNRDDFIRFSADTPHPGIIILIRRKSRPAECGKFLALLQRAGPQGISNNINFA